MKSINGGNGYGFNSSTDLVILGRYTYFEVYFNGKRYGFCSEDDKIKFEEKYPNKFVFKEFNFNYDDFLFIARLEKLMKLLESNPEKVDEELKTKHISDIL